MILPKINSERWLSLDDLDGEVWKDIPRLDCKYAISNYGRLKSLSRSFVAKDGKKYNKPEKIVRLAITRQGYCAFRPSVNGFLGQESIHRLVAEMFVPNPNCLPYINHKDENPSNNIVENLEWCTPKYNSNYGTCQSRRAKTLSDNLNAVSELINQYNVDGSYIRSFRGKKEIVSAGLCYETVRRCCRHLQKRANGFVYRFDGDPFSLLPDRYNCNSMKKKVKCYTMNGIYVATFSCAHEAGIKLLKRESSPGIQRCCRGGRPSAYGYKWRYA